MGLCGGVSAWSRHILSPLSLSLFLCLSYTPPPPLLCGERQTQSQDRALPVPALGVVRCGGLVGCRVDAKEELRRLDRAPAPQDAAAVEPLRVEAPPAVVPLESAAGLVGAVDRELFGLEFRGVVLAVSCAGTVDRACFEGEHHQPKKRQRLRGSIRRAEGAFAEARRGRRRGNSRRHGPCVLSRPCASGLPTMRASEMNSTSGRCSCIHARTSFAPAGVPTRLAMLLAFQPWRGRGGAGGRWRRQSKLAGSVGPRPATALRGRAKERRAERQGRCASEPLAGLPGREPERLVRGQRRHPRGDLNRQPCRAARRQPARRVRQGV